ncbi:MAG: hypothetical protein D6714_14930 [Bacteroidetes bacterium]|nr:MAG: hypothetical protein D6714_14930 [Bacteroidota bacterium]
MSNTIILASRKKSLFMNAGNAKGGSFEITSPGTMLTVVGDAFVNVDVSTSFFNEIEPKLVKENLVAEFDVSDASKQHIVTLTYNQTFRSVAVIGITDIDASLHDQQVTLPLERLNTKGVAVKLMNTQEASVGFIADRALFIRMEKEHRLARRGTQKICIYLLKQS